MVNFDLNNLNVFYNKTSDGEIELSVIDLERYYFGDAIGDFVIQEMDKQFAKKRIVKSYNMYVKKSLVVGKSEEIRYELMCAYLAVIMYAERFSRFNTFSKYFNPMYLAGTCAYIYLANKAFAKLKKFAK